MNGLLRKQWLRAKIFLIDLKDNEWQYGPSCNFAPFNNVVEYKALIARLELSADLNVTSLRVYTDLQ